MRRRVRECQEWMDTNEITDQQEIDNYISLHKLLLRAEELAGRGRLKSQDNGFPDFDSMSTNEFLSRQEAGEFEEMVEYYAARGDSDPTHAVEVMLEEEDYLAWEAWKASRNNKSKLSFLPT